MPVTSRIENLNAGEFVLRDWDKTGFNGPYGTWLVELLTFSLFIHQNSVRAKIAEKVEAYPWSSQHAYTGRNNPLGLVDTDQILRLFTERKSRARAKYREFIADQDTLDKTSVYATIDQRLLGDDEFVERVTISQA